MLSALPAEIKLLNVPPRELELYDFGDFERLVASARAVDPRSYLLTLLGGDAGLRCGEIIVLEWTDIDFQRKVLTAFKPIPGDQRHRPIARFVAVLGQKPRDESVS